MTTNYKTVPSDLCRRIKQVHLVCGSMQLRRGKLISSIAMINNKTPGWYMFYSKQTLWDLFMKHRGTQYFIMMDLITLIIMYNVYPHIKTI